MSVHAKQPGDTGELMFVISDPTHLYTMEQVVALLSKAERLGLPLDKHSPLEQMTIGELDRMLADIGDA